MHRMGAVARLILCGDPSSAYHSAYETFLVVAASFTTKEGLMPYYQPVKELSRRFRLVLCSFMHSGGCAFPDVLSEEKIQQAFDEEEANFGQDEDAIYTPAVTLWASLTQCLFKEEARSYTATVARVIVLMIALGKKPPSDDTGAYTRARAKLPEKVLRRLTRDVANASEDAAPVGWLWHDRHVKMGDGTIVSMPDTEENQEAYPQPSSQSEGLGFPMARIVVLLSLATAMVCDLAIGPYAGKETGETALFRQLMEGMEPGDVFLADRYFCSYFMICLLMELGVDVVVRLHQRRTADFKRGRRLGKKDHAVTWTRPDRPEWMDVETYERMPRTIEVRELQVNVSQPGFRVESLVVVTTLLDANEYTKESLAELYHKRWLVELDIRAIKCTMGMDVLRCKTPAMVHREIWSCLLAYNLIRKAIMEAARGKSLGPRQLSFTAAMQKIAASHSVLLVVDEATAGRLVACHLKDLAGQEVGNRPDRLEPRAVKRRPKPHALLTKPRQEARDELLAGKA
jgi:putative transposase